MIFDTSCFIAIFENEPGSKKALKHLPNAHISIVNYLEMLTVIHRKTTPKAVNAFKQHFQTPICTLEKADAELAAELINQTKKYGLSLGDRACLATAINRDMPVLTADKIWGELDLGVEVLILR